MNTIEGRLQQVRLELEAAASGAPVRLVAVSKTQPVEAVHEAWRAGQREFGENYVQEGVAKIEALALRVPRDQVVWHCIGPLQANKTRLVATHFDWVQSVDRWRIAQRLSEQRPAGMAPLQVCVQVNIDGGARKAGVTPEEASELAQAVATLPGLRLRGLMAIPEPADREADAVAVFGRLKDLFDALRAQGLALDTLSMGMSADAAVAVRCGATLVRVGTAIFGSRGPQLGSPTP